MSERISLAALRERVNGRYAVGAFIGPSDLLALVEAVEADLALEVAEAKGFDLDPAEHREAIARHDAALARFDWERPC